MPHLRIKTFPRPVGDNYPASTWEVLKGAVQDILQKRETDSSFECLYQHAYGMFLHKHGNLLHQSLTDVIAQHLEIQVRVDLLRSIDNNFLSGLRQVWGDFSTSIQIIKDIFMYMDRKVESMEGTLPPVYSMGLTLFRDIVLHYGQIRQQLQQTLLEFISRERQGDASDWETIKAVCVMLVELGAGSRAVYEEDFEKAFLAESVNFFRLEAQRFLAIDNAGDYVRNLEKLIRTEGERIVQYLDKSTKNGIDRIIDEELIQKHMDLVVNMANGGVVSLIQNRNFAEMSSMYKVFNRVSETGMATMLTPISQHLRQQGTALVSEAPTSAKSHVQIIQSLLDLKRGYDQFLDKSFKKDPRFRKMIATEFEHFINLEKGTPELLSLFIDEQLKNGTRNITEQQLGLVLEQAMTLFRYIQDKETFERYYKHHLARRLLLNAKTSADEAEKTMLSKLRHECGYNYTSKLEGMYRDIIVSGTFNDKFRDHMFQTSISASSIDLSVQVLTTGFWPMPPANANVLLPPEAQKAFLDFRKLYLESHNGRQLNIQNNLGTLELSAEFYGAPAVNDRVPSGSPTNSGGLSVPPRKHMIHVTTYQMCVLMLFNKQDDWSYQEIASATNIPEKDLKRALATLCSGKTKLLLKQGGGKVTESSTRFYVNDSFYSQLYRVKINAAARMDFKEDEQESERDMRVDKVESNRRAETDAAIIRILKGRQQLEHGELLTELNNQLRHRFIPTMDLIRKSIEGLIAKQFIARADENRSLYRYIA